MKTYRAFFPAVLLLLFFTSCAHVISSEYVRSSISGVGLSRIMRNPDAYMGKTFILGGSIVNTINTKAGSEIEVVQHPINRYGYITGLDASEGRLIIISPGYLDPTIFRKDRNITFAGILTGIKKKSVGEFEYIYPVFEAKETYLWRETYYQPYMYYPSFYPYYYPYYWHDPFWHGPYWP